MDVQSQYEDDTDGKGSPLFKFVDETIFKKDTYLGTCSQRHFEITCTGQ